MSRDDWVSMIREIDSIGEHPGVRGSFFIRDRDERASRRETLECVQFVFGKVTALLVPTDACEHNDYFGRQLPTTVSIDFRDLWVSWKESNYCKNGKSSVSWFVPWHELRSVSACSLKMREPSSKRQFSNDLLRA